MITETAMASVGAVADIASIKMMADMAFEKWFSIVFLAAIIVSFLISPLVAHYNAKDGNEDYLLVGFFCWGVILMAGIFVGCAFGIAAYLSVIW